MKYNFYENSKDLQDVWNESKVLLKEVIDKMDKEVSFVIHGASFPSNLNEDIGIGSPYANGAKRMCQFLKPLISSIQLGPWGKTFKGESEYNTHSPYTGLLESFNPFFINFKFLTIKAGGNLLDKSLFNLVVKEVNKLEFRKIEYTFVEQKIDLFIENIYQNYKNRLRLKDDYCISVEDKLKEFKEKNMGIVLDSMFNVLVDLYNTYDYKQWDVVDSKLSVLLDDNVKMAKDRYKELYDKNKDEIDKYMLTQLLICEHMQNPKFMHINYIADKQVAIKGSDEWKLQEAILDNINGNEISLGVPPDIYNSKGRNWGMKVLDVTKLFNDKEELTKSGIKVYNIFRKVFKANKGGVRIDHFQGIVDPYVCVNGSSETYNGAGRLLSSFDNEIFKDYLIEGTQEERQHKYELYFNKIIYKAALDEGLDNTVIMPEDLGAITEPTKKLMDKYNLPSMVVTQFVKYNDPNSRYNAKNAKEKDVITTGTHDSPALVELIAMMNNDEKYKLAEIISNNLKLDDKNKLINGNINFNLLNGKFSELFVSKARRIQIYLTHFFGMYEYYNKPGDRSVEKWRTRLSNNFEDLYFENILEGRSINFFTSIIEALTALDYEKNKKIISKLESQNNKLINAIKKAKKESENNYKSILKYKNVSLEERNKMFKKDFEYRKLLAKEIGVKVNDLKQIIGIEELKYIIKDVNINNFNPKHEKFNINLHMHTAESDGSMEVEDLIEQQYNYSKETGKVVLFSVTNHDCIEDTKKVIKILANNCKKYNSIYFISGCEVNTRYNNLNIKGNENQKEALIQFELIMLGFNPFDKEINKFLKQIREGNRKVVQNIIDEYNKWGLGVSLEEASKYTHLDYMGSPGIINSLRKYIKDKFNEKGWIWQDNEHNGNIIFENIIENRFDNLCVTEYTPNYKDIIKLVKESQYGILSIAHPAYIYLNGITVDGDYAIKYIIFDILNNGVDGVGRYYQYKYTEDENMLKWIKKINDYIDFKYFDIYKIGGLDNHGESILKR